MEPEVSLLHSQLPATCPYPVATTIHPIPPHPTSCRSILILPTHLCLGPPSGLFPSGFPTKTLYTPLLSLVRSTSRAYFILDFITRTILGAEYRSLSCSLCSFLQSPVNLVPFRPKYCHQRHILKHPQPHILYTWYILSVLFSSKCSLFHNSNVFGS